MKGWWGQVFPSRTIRIFGDWKVWTLHLHSASVNYVDFVLGEFRPTITILSSFFSLPSLDSNVQFFKSMFLKYCVGERNCVWATLQWPLVATRNDSVSSQLLSLNICESHNFFKLHSPQLPWALRLGISYCLSPPARSSSGWRWCSQPGKTITGKSPNHKPTNWCQTKDVTVSQSHGSGRSC